MIHILVLLASLASAEFTPLPASTPESTNSNFKAIDEEIRRLDGLISSTAAATTSSLQKVPSWTKYTKTYSEFSTAALSSSTILVTTPAKSVVQGTFIHHTSSFSGAGITKYTISVGSATASTRYASAFDVSTATSTANSQFSLDGHCESTDAAWSIYATAVSIGANLNQAIQGSVDIWLLISYLP